MNLDRRKHWQTVYETKSSDQVSWTQDIPQIALDFIDSFRLNRKAKIIDVGAGDSKLVDHLLDKGFENVTVLDISSASLEKAKKRLGSRASLVNWIVSDITNFQTDEVYDLWHDRAAFHFLTTNRQIKSYLEIVKKAVNGYMIMGTFSEKGPKKCSGLEIKRYNEQELSIILNDGFDKIRCLTEDHITPFGTRQNFLFCSFKKKFL